MRLNLTICASIHITVIVLSGVSVFFSVLEKSTVQFCKLRTGLKQFQYIKEAFKHAKKWLKKNGHMEPLNITAAGFSAIHDMIELVQSSRITLLDNEKN